FVSKLCLVPGTDLLISGGGETHLNVWDWPNFTLRRSLALRDASPDAPQQPDVTSSMLLDEESPKHANDLDKDVAVCGLWVLPCTARDNTEDTFVAVALEREAALYIIPTSQLYLPTSDALSFTRIPLDHPLLDIACVGQALVVSLDARETGQTRLRGYKLEHVDAAETQSNAPLVRCAADDELQRHLKCLNDYEEAGSSVETKALDDLLYGVANLRKRRGWGTSTRDDGEDDAAAEDVADD
ncbi:tRNA (guanine-N(7)-)-methyltransferase non-catalytic subunit trm82, partial [Teratosphaeriaceae sp. CCFEE 6253]